MFRPNTNCVIGKTGSVDVYGQRATGKLYKERCAVVTFEIQNIQSSVRADSSASRGAAQEEVANVVVLLSKTTVAAIEDTLTVAGRTLKIATIEPRFNVLGKLDHYRVKCETWSKQ